MTETTTEPRAIPRWSARDRDLWEDLFEAYSIALIENFEQACRNGALQLADIPWKAALMADDAIKECQFRGWVQQKIRRPKPKTKRKSRR